MKTKKPVKQKSPASNNFVAKHAAKFNRAVVMRDRKKSYNRKFKIDECE